MSVPIQSWKEQALGPEEEKDSRKRCMQLSLPKCRQSSYNSEELYEYLGFKLYLVRNSSS